MDFAKTFDVTQFESQINAAVDQAEKNTTSVLAYVQPTSVRENLVTLNKAYFDFARTSMENAKTFGEVVGKVGQDLAKNFEKAAKVAA